MIERMLVACEGALIFGGGVCLWFCAYMVIVGALYYVGLVP